MTAKFPPLNPWPLFSNQIGEEPNYNTFCIFDVNSSTSSTSSISGNPFSLAAANKHPMTTHRQNIATITEMISKIVNIIAHHFYVLKK